MKIFLIILFVVLSLVFLFLVFVVIAAFYSGYQVKKSGGIPWWDRDSVGGTEEEQIEELSKVRGVYKGSWWKPAGGKSTCMGYTSYS